MILRISTKHGETKSVHDGLLVREASKARKCTLVGLQKIHEAAAWERKTIDLGSVWPSINRSTQEFWSVAFGHGLMGLSLVGRMKVGLISMGLVKI